LFIDKSGTLSHVANVAFVCLVAADFLEIGESQEYRQFAKEQIDYMLGGAGKSLSFIPKYLKKIKIHPFNCDGLFYSSCNYYFFIFIFYIH